MATYYYEDPENNPYDSGSEDAGDWEENNIVTLDELVTDIQELAFGDDAINTGYNINETLTTLNEFSQKALALDSLGIEIEIITLSNERIH